MSRRITLVIEPVTSDPDVADGLLERLEDLADEFKHCEFHLVVLDQVVRVHSVTAEPWTQVTSEQVFG